MHPKFLLLLLCLHSTQRNAAQPARTQEEALEKQFVHTADFLDAAISSVNAFRSLVKKESYRVRIASLNNPTSADLGFSLEQEIQTALRPLLAKAKNTNQEKFSEVVTSLLGSQKAAGSLGAPLSLVNPVFPTLMSLVGNLAVREKQITRADLDSFFQNTSRYFQQFEKLNLANRLLEQQVSRMNSQLDALVFDLLEYLMDMICLLYPQQQRAALRSVPAEVLLLKYFDLPFIQAQLRLRKYELLYPADGIKGAKEISGMLTKLFSEYQKAYEENYQQVRSILLDTGSLGRNVNVKQAMASLKELEALYSDSKASDVFSLRLQTLGERLRTLVATEQPAVPDHVR